MAPPKTRNQVTPQIILIESLQDSAKPFPKSEVRRYARSSRGRAGLDSGAQAHRYGSSQIAPRLRVHMPDLEKEQGCGNPGECDQTDRQTARLFFFLQQ